MCAAAATQVEEATVVMEDDAPAAPVAGGSLRRLSSWTIAIPYVDSYEDDAKREKIPVFCIDVERNDRKEGEARGGNLATNQFSRLLPCPIPAQFTSPKGWGTSSHISACVAKKPKGLLVSLASKVAVWGLGHLVPN